MKWEIPKWVNTVLIAILIAITTWAGATMNSNRNDIIIIQNDIKQINEKIDDIRNQNGRYEELFSDDITKIAILQTEINNLKHK
jgi:hypothetical protein